MCGNNEIFEKGKVNKNTAVVSQTKFKNSEFKRAYSCENTSTQSSCVEVAIRPDVIAVRHTSDPAKTTLEYTPDEWQAFIQGVKEGQFDL